MDLIKMKMSSKIISQPLNKAINKIIIYKPLFIVNNKINFSYQAIFNKVNNKMKEKINKAFIIIFN
jgi:hypothetical protein